MQEIQKFDKNLSTGNLQKLEIFCLSIKNGVKRFRKTNYENKKRNPWKRSSNNEAYKDKKKKKEKKYAEQSNYSNDENVLVEKM